MAKTKKSASPAAAKKKPAAKKSTKSAPAPKAAPPLIDTSAAARTAAQLIAHKAARSAAAQPPAPAAAGSKESDAFKNLKQSALQPKTADNLLGGNLPLNSKKSGSASRFNTPFGRGQTQGGFNRSGVPRRTNG